MKDDNNKKVTFRGILNEFHGNYRETTSNMRPKITNQADDLDVPPVSNLDDPQTLQRIRNYVKQSNGVYSNPWAIVKNVHYKLHIVGINFKYPNNFDLPSEETDYQYTVICHGGEFGPTPEGEWKNGSGFEGDFLIQFTIAPTGDGMYTLDSDIIEDIDDDTEMEDMDDDTDDSIGDNMVDVDIDITEELQEGCDCWNNHERVPGTKPCEKGSCRKSKKRVIKEELSDTQESLFLYIENDRDTYNKAFMPAVEKITGKIVAKKYSRKEALEQMLKVVNYGIMRYVKEFGKEDSEEGFEVDEIKMMAKNERLAVAGELVDTFEMESNFGNYDKRTEGFFPQHDRSYDSNAD